MNYTNQNQLITESEQLDQIDGMDLFAEELPEQNDLATPATTLSSGSSLSSGSCPFSSLGTLTSASSLG
jgi:hypothetical protein